MLMLSLSKATTPQIRAVECPDINTGAMKEKTVNLTHFPRWVPRGWAPRPITVIEKADGQDEADAEVVRAIPGRNRLRFVTLLKGIWHRVLSVH